MREFLKGMIRGAFIAIILTGAPLGNAQELAPSTFYSEAVIAQSDGTYIKLLGKVASSQEARASIQDRLAAEFEALKALSAADRERAFQEVLYYYSNKHQRFKEGAAGLQNETGYDWQALVGGNYDSAKLGRSLLKGLERYEKRVMLPLLEQIQAELVRDFSGRNILFLGRDFSQAFLFTRLGDQLDPEKLFTLNISRAIRDQVNDGAKDQMRKLLAQIGLTREKLIKNGLVFLDSSMKGLIPKAVMRAVVEDLSEEEAYRFLSMTDIRYVKARPYQGPGFHQLLEQVKQPGGRISRQHADWLLSQDFPIRVFSLRIPKERQGWDADHIHNLFEHLPKAVDSATGFSAKQGRIYLESPAPRTAAERISSLLGLSADIVLYSARTGKAEQVEAVGPASRKASISRELKRAFQEIDQAAQQGYAGMKNWQSLPPSREALDTFANLALVRTGDRKYPYDLQLNGKTLYRLGEAFGEGRNVRVHPTDRGTVLKIIKDPANARKQLLQAWSEPVLRSYGIEVAEVLWTHPSGILLEQERIPGESLEDLYGHSEGGMPKEVRRQVLEMWNSSLRLAKEKDIWLDFKAANCHLRADGTVVFVDFTPRLNKGFWRYFQEAPGGRQLSEPAFIEEFLYRQIRDGKTVSVRPQNQCEIRLLEKS